MLFGYEKSLLRLVQFSNTRREEDLVKGLSTYLLCSYPTTPSLTDSYQRLTPTSLFGFQNSTALFFQFSNFLYSLFLITCCIIFLESPHVANPYFPMQADKP